MTLYVFFRLLRILIPAALLAEAAVRDLCSGRLPDRLIRLLAASSLLRLIPSSSGGEAFSAILDMVLGGTGTLLLLLAVTRLSDRLFHTDTLGGGDIKLAAALGLHLGLFPALLMILAASLLALPEALLRRRGKRGFPFAPYLSAAGLGLLILSS